MKKRDMKEDCYQDMVSDLIVKVETILNQINNITSKYGIIKDVVLDKDLQKAFYLLELELATLSIMLRKMNENHFIIMSEELRRDINSIIHSNKFEYHNNELIYVYSKRGKEDISIKQILTFARSIL